LPAGRFKLPPNFWHDFPIIKGMDTLDKFIDALHACSVTCEKSATACLYDADVQAMRTCILLNHECAAMCLATARILSSGIERFESLYRACEELCMLCAKENGAHATLLECKLAAQACRNCAEMCRKLQPELAY
jgi:hypothetical protein